MFDSNFRKRAVEGAISREPFIDDNTQGVLIAGRAWMRLDLFGCHVGNSSSRILNMLNMLNMLGIQGAGILGQDGYTKVAQQYLMIASEQHILRLDVAVNQLFIMGILQGVRYLLDIGDDDFHGKPRSPGVVLAQVTISCIVHHQKRSCVLHPEVQHLDDMRMAQMGNGACLGEETLRIMTCQLPMEYFYGSLGM